MERPTHTPDLQPSLAAPETAIVFRASFAQEALWLEDQLQASRAAYNVALVTWMRGPLDATRLAHALAQVVARHESLRTRFAVLDGELSQIVQDPPSEEEAGAAWAGTLLIEDLRGRADLDRRAHALALAERDAAQPFDLAAGPLLRARLVRISDHDHLLVLSMHHIISDGWSVGVLLAELGALYHGQPLASLTIQYGDFAEWQRQWLTEAKVQEQLGYWAEALRGAEPLALLSDRPRPALRSGRGRALVRQVDPAAARRIPEVARRLGVTPHLLLLTAWGALLGRVSRQSDVCIGTPTAGRKRPEVEGLIGYLVNTVVVRVRWSAEATFAELVAQVKTSAAGAYAHEDVPFARVVQALRPEREPGRNPLFQAAFSIQDAPPTQVFAELELAPVELYPGAAKVDLTLHVAPRGEQLSLALEYAAELYDEATAAQLLEWLLRLLEEVLHDPARRLATISLVTEEERSSLAEWGRGPVTALEPSLLAMVERWARLRPDAVAVSAAGQGAGVAPGRVAQLGYAALWKQTQAVAARLRARGLGRGDVVGLYLDRRCELLPVLLGVLACGAAYSPFDVGAGAVRLRALRSKLAAVVTSRLRRDELQDVEGGGPRSLILDEDLLAPGDDAAAGVDDAVGDLHPAYVLYTSGSTGQPKGVVISRRALHSYLHWAAAAYAPPQQTTARYAPVHSSLAFDLTVTSLLAPLIEGGEVALLDGPQLVDELVEILAARPGPCLVKLTPAHLECLVNLLGAEPWARLDATFVVGGEALTTALVRRVAALAPRVRIWNEYGPTEATVGCSVQLADPSETRASIPIGRPVGNARLLVLDRELALVPRKVPGELYLGGAGLASGYLGAPRETARAFVPDPFGAPGERLYRTGDLVRWLDDGSLEFLGRIDHQLKVRGYRIEPGEIEAALLACPGVAAAVVTAVGEGAERVLAGYVAPSPGAALDAESLRALLQARLPPYLVPGALMVLSSIPLTDNGKVDRRALPHPVSHDGPAVRARPRGMVEQLLAAIWAEAFAVAEVGVDEDFFVLGGHSLLATQVVARVRSAFQIELPLRTLFEAPTVAQLARRVEEALRQGRHAARPPYLTVPRTGHEPLSYAQQRLWLLDQLEPGSARYNIAGAVRLRGPLPMAALERSISALVERHEALRTTFQEREGEPCQVVHLPDSPAAASLRRTSPVAPAALAGLLSERAATSFALDAGPLWRLELFPLTSPTGQVAPGAAAGTEDHVLLLVAHHIVADGWSLALVIRELSALMRAAVQGLPAALPPLRTQYVDYAVRQRTWLRGDALAAQLAYWREALAGAPALLALPTDHERPAVQSTHGLVLPFEISPELTLALRGLCQRESVTLFMVLHAALALLLARSSGQPEVVIGTPIANRTESETEGLVGVLVNTLALRTSARPELTLRELLVQVRARALAAYAHQDAPFEKVVELLDPERSLGHAPVFQVLLSLEQAAEHELEVPGVSASVLEVEHSQIKLDLAWTVREHADRLRGALELSRDLFDDVTAASLRDQYLLLLAQLAGSLDVRVADVPRAAPAERERLLAWGAAGSALAAARQALQARLALTADAADHAADRAADSAADGADAADRLPDRADEDARAALALPVALRLLAQGQAAQVLVLDAALQPVPVGAWGELFLGLAPLAELPWRGSAADAARLLPNPFAAVPASRMVRVQQRARWRGEGQLQLARPAGQLALAPATPTSAPHEALSPEHPLRRQVAALFAEVLGAPVPADRSFFAAGGHSLLASRLVARLRERLGVAIGLRAVFEHPTVDGLAAELLRQLAQQRGSSPRTPRRIPRAPRTTELPVSFAQERLWFLDRLLAGAAGHGAGELAYVVPVVATLRGPLQRPALAAALAAVVARHEVLRASFATEGSSVVQRLSAGTSNVLELVEAQGWSPAQLAAEIEAEARRPFALARGPLWRARLLALSPAQHVLLLTLHHIVCDGWSMGVLVDELGLLYSAHVRGELASLPELELQYADYAAWQRQSLASGQLADDLVFWREQLAGLPTLELPTDHRRPAEQSYRGASVQRRLSPELASALRGLAQRHDATLFMVLLAGFATLLSKLSGQRDFAVGTPVAGRADGQLEGLVGLFVNTLVLRQRWQGEPAFAELVRQVRASTLRAFEHQDVPFERLVEELRPERDLSRNPLVQVMFEVATGMRRPPRFVGLELELAEGDTGAAKLDLLVHVEDEGADLLVTLEYASDLYDAASADRMLAQYERLLASAIAHPGHRLGELDVLDPGERARLAAWNQTSHPLPASLLAHERFEEVVRRAPGRLAASDDRERLDYATLNARANGVAHALLAAGVGPEDRVVLYSERDVNLLAAILGTWKAGAAYVPVDPAYPTDRVRQILMRSACRVVVIGRSVLQDLEASADSFGGLPVLVLEDLVTAGGPNPGRPVAPSQLAYAIFTSGSTGVPKGAMVEHRGMFNHLLAKEVELALGESDSIIQNASQCFDISVWQFLVCVLRGGRVHVVSNQVAYDPEALLRLTREERITVLEVVPEVLRGIVELAGGVPPDLGLRWMVVTGEALPPELTRRWLAWAPRIPLVNAYGPTECSDDVTHHILRDPMPVDAVATPIGRPILNMYMYVLDEHLALQPVGARGELYVGGVGVGRGYLDDPGQTAQAFLPNPYGEPGERMYRTGDVVRWLADGTLEFLGRVDHQVKVRGYRIELGEIESVLGRHPGVDAAVVEVRGEGRAANLVAYVVPRASWRWDREVLRAWVQGALPAYMVPVKWVELAALPLSPNGKIDRRALPAPETSEPFGAGEPRSLAEAQVLALWRESFDGIALGIDDDFFALGGHSLLAAQLHGKMVELLGVKFPLRRLFEAPTVRRLMEHVLSDQLAAASVTTREELVTEVQDLTEEQALALLRKLQAE